MNPRAAAWILTSLLLAAGCARGPAYQRPVVDAPAAFRGAESATNAASLADTDWPDLFDDPVLTRLTSRALEANHDLRIAAERVLQAREQYGIRESELLPAVDLDGGFSADRNSRVGAFDFGPGGQRDASYTEVGFRMGWDLDVWGRLRSLSDSALAAYLATEEARRGVQTTLIADVTGRYLTLRALDRELEIGRETRSTAEASLRLTRLREELGVASALDVYQAEQFLRSATAEIAASERAIAQAENGLSVLVGDLPGSIPRGRTLDGLAAPAEVPVGLPSTLLARRPDIREAEQRLIAASADIGAARARFFPLISLTGFLGAQTQALTSLFTGPARQWSFSPLASLPIFNAGRLRSERRFAEAVERETVARYEQTIQRGFREVADALAAYNKTREQLREQALMVEALRESSRLATLRYEGGVDSFLQVLDADRSLFQAELAETRLRRDVLLAVVDLYRALGGGWY